MPHSVKPKRNCQSRNQLQVPKMFCRSIGFPQPPPRNYQSNWPTTSGELEWRLKWSKTLQKQQAELLRVTFSTTCSKQGAWPLCCPGGLFWLCSHCALELTSCERWTFPLATSCLQIVWFGEQWQPPQPNKQWCSVSAPLISKLFPIILTFAQQSSSRKHLKFN